MKSERAVFAVIFSSKLKTHAHGYETAAAEMLARVSTQPGYLGAESVRGADGVGITVSYWSSEEAIAAWKNDAKHAATRDRGRNEWYEYFHVRVCKIERECGLKYTLSI